VKGNCRFLHFPFAALRVGRNDRFILWVILSESDGDRNAEALNG